MKKILFALLAISVILPSSLFAAGVNGKNTECATKYPIVLMHGMFQDDNFLMIFEHWYGIPEALEDRGAAVFVTDTNSMGDPQKRGLQLAKQAEEFRISQKAEKIHIIGHSHGNPATRYAISHPGMKDLALGTKVASFTGLGGVNRGTQLFGEIFMKALGKLPYDGKILLKLVDLLVAFGYGDDLSGDPNGSISWSCFDSMRPSYMYELNKEMPDLDGVYYQTFTGNITKPSLLKPLGLSGFMIKNVKKVAELAGENPDDYINCDVNDGCVELESAVWGNYRGLIPHANWSSGIDHGNEINQFLGMIPGFDGPAFYVNIVKELKEFEQSGYPKFGDGQAVGSFANGVNYSKFSTIKDVRANFDANGGVQFQSENYAKSKVADPNFGQKSVSGESSGIK